MKVEKIKITKELIDIEKDKPYEEIIVDGLDQLITEGEIKDYMTTAVRVPYKIVDYADKYGGIIKSYLVKVSDSGIFNELLELSKNDLAQHVKDRTLVLEEGAKNIAEITRDNIKKLPLWKRIINDF